MLLGLTDDPLEARGVPAICAEPSAQLDALDLGTEFTTAVRNTLAASSKWSVLGQAGTS